MKKKIKIHNAMEMKESQEANFRLCQKKKWKKFSKKKVFIYYFNVDTVKWKKREEEQFKDKILLRA